MRPVELVFKGLNSYTEEARIDFRRLHKAGIFGIFGETGAGKTTILDAITIALYSKTDRLTSISEVTNPASDRVFVRFKFEMDGKLYEVYREFHRGMAKSQALYEITHAGTMKPLADKAREITELIKEKIIGLTFEEFTKVVILPQGKFSRFLDSSPADKSVILGKIFGTDIFGERLFDAVRNRKDVIQKNIETIKRSIDNLGEISEEKIKELTEEQKRLTGEIKKLRNEKRILEERARTLERLKELLEERQALQGQIDDLKRRDPEIKRLKERLEIAEKLSPYAILVKSIEELEKRKTTLGENIKNLRLQLSKVRPMFEKKQKNWENFIQKEYPESQMQLKLTMENARKAEERQDKLKRLNRKLEQLISEARKYEDELADLEKFTTRLKEVKNKIQELKLSTQEEKLLGLEAHLNSLKTHYDHVEGELKKLNHRFKENKVRLKSRIERILKGVGIPEDTEEPENALNELLNKTREAREKAEIDLKEMERKNLAATLALDLKDGEPCPVCGSIHHPNPAIKKIENTEIESLKDRIKKLEAKERNLIQRYTEVRKLLEDLGIEEERYTRERSEILRKVSEFNEKIDKIAQEFQCDGLECLLKKIDSIKHRKREMEKLAETERDLNEKIQHLHEAKGKLNVLKAEIRQTQELIIGLKDEIQGLVGKFSPQEVLKKVKEELSSLENKKERLHREFNDLKKDFENIETEIAKVAGLLSETERSLKESKEKLGKTAKRLGITEDELKSSILPEEEIEKLRNRIKEYDDKLRNLQAGFMRINEEIQKLPLKELPDGEPEKTKRALEEVTSKLDLLNFKLGEIGRMIRDGRDRLEQKGKLEKELEEARKVEGYLSELYSLLHGKKFSRFVARFYLNEIIREANRFLYNLTGGRLKILGTRGDEIEFQIFDAYTGHPRSTKSLSGGERFIVSFSLAISFSLYIQNRRTRSIDFFFIDEGFGTLDDELQEAMGRVFEEIQREGKLVGLITHVKKFRHLVPAQIIVTRDPETRSSKVQILA